MKFAAEYDFFSLTGLFLFNIDKMLLKNKTLLFDEILKQLSLKISLEDILYAKRVKD